MIYDVQTVLSIECQLSKLTQHTHRCMQTHRHTHVHTYTHAYKCHYNPAEIILHMVLNGLAIRTT